MSYTANIIEKPLSPSVAKTLKMLPADSDKCAQFPLSKRSTVYNSIHRIQKKTDSNKYTTKTDEAFIYVWRIA